LSSVIDPRRLCVPSFETKQSISDVKKNFSSAHDWEQQQKEEYS